MKPKIIKRFTPFESTLKDVLYFDEMTFCQKMEDYVLRAFMKNHLEVCCSLYSSFSMFKGIWKV